MNLARFALAFIALAAPAATPSPAEVDRVLHQLSEVTGLAVKRPVRLETMTRSQWNQWLQQELKRRVKPEEIRTEELVLKKFGLVPRDFDLKKTTVDLLTEQAAAFYDHRKKKMVFVEGEAGGLMQDVVLAHELAHALADQHFPLTRFVEAHGKSDDAQTARMAVVEGQAMWLMMELPLRAMGASMLKGRPLRELLGQAGGAVGSGLFPVFDNAPLYLKETLIFPYRDGALFQQALAEKWGQRGFSEPLRNPPVSTQQVIHPEAYFERRQPFASKLPPLSRAGYRRLSEGSLGELDLRILLQQYGGEPARRLAPGWRGGSFDLSENRKSGASILRWTLEWDTEETAREFLRQYRKVLSGKSKRMDWVLDTPDRLEGSGDDGDFRIHLSGSRVDAEEGLPSEHRL